jgi:hypothetical protein
MTRAAVNWCSNAIVGRKSFASHYDFASSYTITMSKKNAKGAFGHQRKQMPSPSTQSFEIPDDVKTDIAKVVRSVDWRPTIPEGGLCFLRALTGWLVLTDLEIPAKPVLGGMVYRAGLDEQRDVLPFCGPGYVGCTMYGRFLGHYWVLSGNDFVDFSVGDWKENAHALEDYCPPGMQSLDPIQWTAPELPAFFWADRSLFAGIIGRTPSLGKAWYTGFAGDSRTSEKFQNQIDHFIPTLRAARKGHLLEVYKYYALKERLFAAREGHTAVRFSQLARIIGDESRIDRSKEYEQLFVLRGKQEITKDVAWEILSEAGL